MYWYLFSENEVPLKKVLFVNAIVFRENEAKKEPQITLSAVPFF
jgi:hypothetical protein